MTEDTKEIVKFMSVIGGAVVGLVVIVLLLSMWGAAVACPTRWDRPTQWGPLQGCRVWVDGRWVPEQNVREFIR